MSAPEALRIGLLADRTDAFPVLRDLFERQWPDYYGPDGPGDATADLQAYCGRDQLPIGLVAIVDGDVVGIAALKAEPLEACPDLGPWASAGLVAPQWRGRGIGADLIVELERLAARLGFDAIYTGTATAGSLMRRLGWTFLNAVEQRGETLEVFCKRWQT